MSYRPSSDRAAAVSGGCFRAEMATGAMRGGDGRRVVAITEPMVRHLHAAIIKRLGENAQDALYRIGYEWALQMMTARVQQHRAAQPNVDFWQQDTAAHVSAWWQMLAAQGWGAATFDFQAHARHITFVEVRQSMTADALAGAEHPVCHLYAGLLAGALSFCSRSERHAVEVACAATGQDRCSFVVAPGAEVDAAEAWRQQGVTSTEILRRLT